MSLSQATAFYQSLHHDAALYAQYLTHCSFQPVPMGAALEGCDRQWDETAILNFAAERGYCFGLGDLYQVWFGQPDYRTAHMEQVGLRMSAIARLNRQLA